LERHGQAASEPATFTAVQAARTARYSAPQLPYRSAAARNVYARAVLPGFVVLTYDVPVLLRIARASLDEHTAIVTADLRDTGWAAALPHHDYDAVLTATALHWLPADRLAALYGEIRQVLRTGGVFINVDHMPDEGLPTVNERLADRERAKRDARYASGAVLSWEAWWDHVAKDPTLGPLIEQRKQIFSGNHSAEFDAPASWHLEALREADFSEVGIIWRGARDAAVTALR
jgi:SAM-dependent methyltransferase